MRGVPLENVVVGSHIITAAPGTIIQPKAQVLENLLKTQPLLYNTKTNTGHTLVKYIRAVKYKLLISVACMRTDLTILSKGPVVRTADLTCKTWREQFVRAGCVLA